MMGFRPNPIVIHDNGKPSRIIELKHDLEEESFALEVLDKNQILIKHYEMDLSTLISIDKKYGEVTLVYRDLTGHEIDRETHNLLQLTQSVVVKKKDNDLEAKLSYIVKQQMDFPSGTPAEISNHTEMLKRTTMDRNARTYVMSKIRNILVSSNLVSSEELERYVYDIYSDLYGMGVLQELDDDLSIGEIMVNASVFPRFNSDIYYIKDGVKYRFNKEFKNFDDMKNVFSRSVEFNKKELNSVENSVIEATRANKDRVNVLIPEASENWILNIRKFSNFLPNLDMMRKSGTVDDYIDRLMDVWVRGKANIGIGGPMGTGKTTFINYLLTYTEPIERKVVIASVSETDVQRVLKGHDVVILNVNEEKNLTFEKLIRASLRTTASRVIIPESRGSEFKQVYEANLKTKGNMFTGHALDDQAFMEACVDMYLSSSESSNENSEYVKDKIAKSMDGIVIMRKVGDKIRIKSISEVLLDKRGKYVGTNVLYKWEFDPENPLEGHYERTENRMSTELKLRLNENGVPMSQLKDL